MHDHNRYRGQQEILAQFVGEPDPVFPPPIPGHLQHEWDEFEVCPQPSVLPAGFVFFVWSDRARRRLTRRGQRRLVAIGAPWLYLLERHVVDDWAVPPPVEATPKGQPVENVLIPDGAAWFPHHGLEGAHLAGMLAHEITVLTPGPVTVVLTAPDAHVGPLRYAYERLGMTVTTLPPRVRPAGWWGPGQLETLRAIVARHRWVASNVLDVALLLGGAAGLRPLVDGPVSAGPGTGRTGRASEMLSGNQRLRAVREYCLTELGEDAMLSAAELRMLLDWDSRD